MKYILIITLAFLLNSCFDEESITNEILDSEIIDTDTYFYGNGKVVGYLKDEDGNPLSGVSISYGEKETFSDGNGFYEFVGLSTKYSNNSLLFYKEGYFKLRGGAYRKGFIGRFDRTLQKIVDSYPVTNDGAIIDENNYTISIPQDCFVNRFTKELIDEEIQINVKLIDINNKGFLNSFYPLHGASIENKLLLAMEVEGPIDYVELNKEITIEINHPEIETSTNLWDIHPEKILNLEEGNIIFKTQTLGSFNLFKYNNFQSPFRLYSFTVEDKSGSALSHCYVQLKSKDNNFIHTQFEFNRDGKLWSTFIQLPPNTDIEAQAFFQKYSSEIIEFNTSDTNMFELRFNEGLVSQTIPVFYDQDTLFLTPGEETTLKFANLPENYLNTYKADINGINIPMIEKNFFGTLVSIPENIPDNGFLVVSNGVVESCKIPFVSGNWKCSLNDENYDNNVLPLIKSELGYGPETEIEVYKPGNIILPECFNKLSNLNLLELSSDGTGSLKLENDFNELYNLYQLKINNFKSLIGDINFTGNEHLQEIYIKDVPFNDNQLSTKDCKNLKLILLENNDLDFLPDNLNKNYLERLILEESNLKLVESKLSDYNKLKDLTLTNNKIQKFQEGFGEILTLQSLSLEINNLNDIKELEKIPDLFPNLISLNLRFNNINEIPDNFSKLKLKSLFIGGNNLTDLQIQNLQEMLPETNISLY
jgi:hypothetical protein